MLLMWLMHRTRPDRYIIHWVEYRAQDTVRGYPGTGMAGNTLLASVLGNALPAGFLFILNAWIFGMYNTVLDLHTPLLDWWNTASPRNPHAPVPHCDGACSSHSPPSPRSNIGGMVGRTGFVIVISLIVALWWLLTCIATALVAHIKALPHPSSSPKYSIWVLQYVGACVSYLIAMDVLLLTSLFLLPIVVVNVFVGHISVFMHVDDWFIVLVLCLIIAMDMICLLIIPHWTAAIGKHFRHFERRWLVTTGIVWAGILAGPVWMYLLIVREGYVNIFEYHAIDQDTIIIWTFVLALNGVVFAAVKKLYMHVTRD